MEEKESWRLPNSEIKKGGFVDKKRVKSFLFIVISLSLFISIMIIILAIWDYVGQDFAYKAVATLATLITGLVAFSWINDYFGSNKE